MRTEKANIIVEKIKATLYDLEGDPTCFQDDNLMYEIVEAIVEANNAMAALEYEESKEGTLAWLNKQRS